MMFFQIIPNLIIIQPNPSSIKKRKPEVRRKKSDYIVIAFGIKYSSTVIIGIVECLKSFPFLVIIIEQLDCKAVKY